jgi:hypothetical protein
VSVARETGEKMGDLGFSHLQRVSLVEEDKAPDPLDIGFLQGRIFQRLRDRPQASHVFFLDVASRLYA